MKVFKFGGASIADANGIRNVAQIIQSYANEKLVVVVSASGKITNELEKLLAMWYADDAERQEQLDFVNVYHLKIIADLFPDSESRDQIMKRTKAVIKTIEALITDEPSSPIDEAYDKMVSLGEIISSDIVFEYLKKKGIACQWLDAREVISTNDIFREAKVDWTATSANIRREIGVSTSGKVTVTQGFIASSAGKPTTLGREGSDFSAAIFAYALNAEGVYIWKDVPGVLNADPGMYDDTIKIDHLSYRDAIEMTYYGAKVIHPKTIKPLQNKEIPLFVKSFQNPTAEGTLINNKAPVEPLPPVVVIKPDQVLLYISTLDFSFIAEENLSQIYKLFADHKIKINMMQNTAISFTACFDHHESKLEQLLDELRDGYETDLEKNLKLFTVKYYNDQIISKLKEGCDIVLEERIRHTVQLLVRPSLD